MLWFWLYVWTHMHDISLVGTNMASWNFVLPNRDPNTKHTIEDLNIAHILVFPKIWLWRIFALVLWLHVTLWLGPCSMMCCSCANSVDLIVNGDGFVSSTPNFASFCVVKHCLRDFWSCRHRWWFDQKTFSKYNRCLELYKKPIVCPPCMSLHLLVNPFPNLSTKELVELMAWLKDAHSINIQNDEDERHIYFLQHIGWETIPYCRPKRVAVRIGWDARTSHIAWVWAQIGHSAPWVVYSNHL